MLRRERKRSQNEQVQSSLREIDALPAQVLPFRFYKGTLAPLLSKRKGKKRSTGHLGNVKPNRQGKVSPTCFLLLPRVGS